MASVSIDSLTVGDEDNRVVTIEATKNAPTGSYRVDLRWTVSVGAIPPGTQGGLGPETLVFGAGSLDPGVYNVQAYVYDHSDESEATATGTFTIPSLPLHLDPAPPRSA